MSRQRRLAIAAQAVTVAVLVAIVYVTLLQPDEGRGLSGVRAPDGGRAQVRAPDAAGERGDRQAFDPHRGAGGTVAD